ncbi:MAG: DEAD/DEAH box helicase family protein [Isosphaeraceae bacterium]
MGSPNFEHLRPDWPELAVLGAFADEYAYSDPKSALVKLRSFAERIVEFLYYHHGLSRPYQANLMDLLNEHAFRQAVPDVIQSKLHQLRIKGNRAAHDDHVDAQVACQMVRVGYDLGKWLFLTCGSRNATSLPQFREPSPSGGLESRNKLQREKKAVLEQFAALEAKYQQLLQEVEAKRAQSPRPAATPEQLETAKVSGGETADTLGFDEETTRSQLIDALLMAAGWDPADPSQVGKEVRVRNQPTPTGEGLVDYVLWGENGKPLGVIEAKRTSKDPAEGRTQAELYAEALRAQFGQRPIIFCTNGFEISIWDRGQDDSGQYDPVRRIYGFHSRDSLEYLVFQARYRLGVKSFGPDTDIVDRPYQALAVRQVLERFAARRRKALIVQATGTGKTWVAIALCEALIRARWARRILFLCDRRELRKQADDAFQQLLPGEPRTFVNAGTFKDREHRIYLATYPAMMKVYESFDVGFFDLVIADESHRSIYNRYRELLDYFDALQVGLTATPVQFISRNTFKLLDCEEGKPTASYSLKEAVEADYLVPPKVIDHTTAFLREGIKYENLTGAQRRQLEEEEIEPDTVRYEAEELDKRIFNKDTNRKILQNLMEEGIRDASGSLVGKTIIFARNHNHAVLLEKLFDELYPQYGSKVCRIIDNYDPRAQDLIDAFKDPKSLLRVAISVDMLDTGIDVPEVVNLVFARPVFSYVKFRQMIGRGTRLCPHLFGPNERKTHFLIFDHWGNFARFEGLDEEDFAEAEPSQSKSLLQRLFESRIDLAEAAKERGDHPAFERAVDLLTRDINDLPEATIRVREKWKQLQAARDPQRLKQLDPGIKAILTQDVAPLMQWRDLKGDHAAFEFDLLVSRLQTELVKESDQVEGLKDDLLARLDELPPSLNQVRARAETIGQVRSPAFWDGVSSEALEDVRNQLRSTMQYRTRQRRAAIAPRVIDIREETDLIETRVRKVTLDDLDKAAYRSRVRDALEILFDENETLQKIKAGQPVTPQDLQALTSLVLTQEPDLDLNDLVDYYPETAGQLDLAIRRIIGLDAATVRTTFERFIRKHPTLTSTQIQFLDMLQNYIAKYGSIALEKLYEEPFTSINAGGVDNVFGADEIDDLIAIIEAFQAPGPQGGKES